MVLVSYVFMLVSCTFHLPFDHRDTWSTTVCWNQSEVKEAEILHPSTQAQSLFNLDKLALIGAQKRENKLPPSHDEWKRRVKISYALNFGIVLRLITFSMWENTLTCVLIAHTHIYTAFITYRQLYILTHTATFSNLLCCLSLAQKECGSHVWTQNSSYLHSISNISSCTLRILKG